MRKMASAWACLWAIAQTRGGPPRQFELKGLCYEVKAHAGPRILRDGLAAPRAYGLFSLGLRRCRIAFNRGHELVAEPAS